jgi:hypothetical protein
MSAYTNPVPKQKSIEAKYMTSSSKQTKKMHLAFQQENLVLNDYKGKSQTITTIQIAEQ